MKIIDDLNDFLLDKRILDLNMYQYVRICYRSQFIIGALNLHAPFIIVYAKIEQNLGFDSKLEDP